LDFRCDCGGATGLWHGTSDPLRPVHFVLGVHLVRRNVPETKDVFSGPIVGTLGALRSERYARSTGIPCGRSRHSSAYISGRRCSAESRWLLWLIVPARRPSFEAGKGGISLGCASATREAACLGRTAFVLRRMPGGPRGFAGVGHGPPPCMKALTEAWAAVVRVVPPDATVGCSASSYGHGDHSGMECLLTLASQQMFLRDQGALE
jgi:hypothetical protein